MAGVRSLLLFLCALFNLSFGIKPLCQRNDSASVKVQELEIVSNIVLRYANVSVRSLMFNPQKQDQESTFRVRLPKQAYITGLEIETNNKTIKAEIKDRRVATTEDFKQANKDDETVRLVNHLSMQDDIDVNIFQIQVNVAGNSEIEFRLQYEEFLQRRNGHYTHKLYIDTVQMIPKLVVKCNLKEKEQFKAISYKTPFARKQNALEGAEKTNDDFQVKTIVWKPNEINQTASVSSLEVPFEVTYSLEESAVAFYNDIGEFIHFFSETCNTNKILAKRIVFVIDTSRSMNETAFQQIRKAMKYILMQLRTKDYFNIILFDDRTPMWKTNFQKANPGNVDKAKIYIDQYILEGGSTNINDTLLEAVRLFETSKITERTGNIIMFLTDGPPKVGVTNTNDILRNVRYANYGSEAICCISAIHPIAFGRNADMSFLRSLAYQNAGSLTNIQDIESNMTDTEVIDMYKSIENPFFQSINFWFRVGDNDIHEENITRTFYVQYDCGEEIVISGRGPVGEIIKPRIKADNVVFLFVESISLQNNDSVRLSRLVGYQWLRHHLIEAESAIEHGKRDKARKLALELSLKYGFLTSLTSLVVLDYQTNSETYTEPDNGKISLDSASKGNSLYIAISSLCLYFGISMCAGGDLRLE